MIEKFTIGFSRTKNLGNYESARVEASITYEMEVTENLQEAQEYAQAKLRALIEDTWKAQTHPKPNGSKP